MSSNKATIYSSDSYGNNPLSYKSSIVNCNLKNDKVVEAQRSTYPTYTPTQHGYDIESVRTVSTYGNNSKTFTKFVAQTLNYVSMQLIFTMIICGIIFHHKDHVLNLISKNSSYFWLPIIFTFISLIGLHFSENNSFSQSLWFLFFTISCSFMVSLSVLQYSPNVVTKAVFTTGIIVMCINAYSHYAARQGIDFSYLGSALISCLFALIIIGLLNIFIKSDFLGLIVSFFGVLVFIGFLLFDLNRLYYKNQNNDEYFESPMIAAVGIYLDIINLFLYLLELYNKCEKGEGCS